MKLRINKIHNQWFVMQGSTILEMHETLKDAQQALKEIIDMAA